MVDKMEKLPRDKVEALLAELEVPASAIDGALDPGGWEGQRCVGGWLQGNPATPWRAPS